MIKNLTYTFILLTGRFVRVKIVFRVMINFAIVRFAPEVTFTAHDANLLITVWVISYGQVRGFSRKTACFIISLGFIFVTESPVLHLIEIDRFV